MKFDTADSSTADENDTLVPVNVQVHPRLDLPAMWARRLQDVYVEGYTRALIDIRAIAKLPEEAAHG